ncbi:dipeptide transport system substrate-binding protein [Tistlia consotensis]|uniref:Dipeptide transport system substrate-binding protein n=1 Tax=Tistlia consotensis USBA 355 TaxID=560819 RepID=A0A1Y6BUX6_9PROT|nr:ABC transporter substrate-binding protein [Tistlia consotensis]SMF21523.1 dipeptide transport system substrate-binding protein [Tistlia consotensis USBA 355]SNR46846.1 dipeptide transport system substrate-binding protein [Tistlia consotensis]
MRYRLCGILAATLALSVAGAASAKTLVYCSEGSPEGFDPAPYTAGTTFDASSKPIYNRLVEFERGTTNVIPGLAESWTVSPDGKEYTFKLRPGVKFHKTGFFTPTRDFNADDVLFSFNRQLKKDDPWHEYTAGIAYEYFDGMSMPELIKDIVKVDDMTVKFVLTRPEAPMLADLAMDFASILSKEYADQLAAAGHKEKLNQEPVGTGPFQFVAYQKDAVIRYKANPDYWEGKQAIDNLVFAITTDAAVRQQKLLAGECQVMPYPNPADVPALEANANIQLMEQEGLNVGYLAYNTKMPPFDKVEVRKALNMAINKKAILDAVFQGAGRAAINPIPPTMWSYDKAIKDDPYDPAAAKKMLADAGVKDLKMKIWAMPVQRPYNPNARRMAELIQADFAKVGVEAEIVSYEWGEYLKLSKAEDRDGAVLLGWTGDNGDPDNFLAVLLGCDAVGGANRAQWCNKEFDDLIQKAKVTSDKAERTKLYEQAQVVFKREAPWATIAHSVVFMPMSKKVQGYKMDPLGSHRFDGVSLAD